MTNLTKLYKLISGALVCLSASLLANTPDSINNYNIDYYRYNRIASCEDNYAFELRGEYLYWRAHEDDLGFVAITNDRGHEHAAISTITRKPKFQYDSGFRIGAGYKTCWCFDFEVDWTHFDTSSDKSCVSLKKTPFGDDAVLTPTLIAPFDIADLGITNNFINGKWKLRLNYVDFGIRRDLLCQNCFSIGVCADLRWASIQQHFITDVSAFFKTKARSAVLSKYASKLESHFNGIGPRIGLDLDWNIGCDVNFFTSGAAAILFGNTRSNYRSIFADTRDVESRGHYHSRDYSSHFATDFEIGLGWRPDFFCGCGWDLGLTVAWEHHLFFNMNNWGEAHALGQDHGKRHGDLSLQGLTVAADLRF